MQRAAEAWSANPPFQQDPQVNRQFMVQFAIILVQQFRTEEERLLRARAPQFARRRGENQRLALRVRDLLADLGLGLEVTPSIQQFLEAWRDHQQGLSGCAEAEAPREH